MNHLLSLYLPKFIKLVEQRTLTSYLHIRPTSSNIVVLFLLLLLVLYINFKYLLLVPLFVKLFKIKEGKNSGGYRSIPE